MFFRVLYVCLRVLFVSLRVLFVSLRVTIPLYVNVQVNTSVTLPHSFYSVISCIRSIGTLIPKVSVLVLHSTYY